MTERSRKMELFSHSSTSTRLQSVLQLFTISRSINELPRTSIKRICRFCNFLIVQIVSSHHQYKFRVRHSITFSAEKGVNYAEHGLNFSIDDVNMNSENTRSVLDLSQNLTLEYVIEVVYGTCTRREHSRMHRY